jgi:hypothetical protein
MNSGVSLPHFDRLNQGARAGEYAIIVPVLVGIVAKGLLQNTFIRSVISSLLDKLYSF